MWRWGRVHGATPTFARSGPHRTGHPRAVNDNLGLRSRLPNDKALTRGHHVVCAVTSAQQPVSHNAFSRASTPSVKTIFVPISPLLQAMVWRAQNVANKINYDTFGSQNIQSSIFGRLDTATDGAVTNSPRRMQLSTKYNF